MQNPRLSLLIFAISILLFSCAPNTRFGMIEDPNTGLLYGSVVGKSFFIDPSQFENNKIKVTVRNVSGDSNFSLRSLSNNLTQAFSDKGYQQAQNNDFGIKLDVVVEYSGHVQKDMASQYGFLGAAGGGIAGYKSSTDAGAAIGILSGATLGAIIGSNIKDDTYIIVTKINIGIKDTAKKDSKRITFGSSPKLQEEETSIRAFSETSSTKIAVYAGGRNVSQSEIVEGVRNRLISIISDII
jgi:hypothetical protein